MDPLLGFALPSDLTLALSRVDEFKGEWRGRTVVASRLSELRRIATIESVGSSTRIEGVTLTDIQVASLLRGPTLAIEDLEERDEQEVAGYAAAVELVLTSHAEIELSESHVHQLHQTLLQYSHRDERHRGHYKTMPNSIQAFDASGRSVGVLFETATPFDTPRLMQELLAWTSLELQASRHHPLIVIAVFVVRFLAVHPYQDGNGRLSRLLTTLLLLRSGYPHVAFVSLERIVESRKQDYYRTLNSAQRTLGTDESGRESWIRFFIEILDAQVTELRKRLAVEANIAELPPLAADLLELVRTRGRITPREAQRVTAASIHTIKAHLQRLVREGRMQRCGVGRGTWYAPGSE